MSRTPLAVNPTLWPILGGDCPAASNRRLCARLITRTGCTPAPSNSASCRFSAALSFTTSFRYARMAPFHHATAKTQVARIVHVLLHSLVTDLGAVEAIAARNLQGKIAVVGIDATREAVRAVKAGRLAGDVAMYPETLGRNAVEAAIKAARGEPVEKRIHTGQALVTRENADDFLR